MKRSYVLAVLMMCVLLFGVLHSFEALAQARNPFGVGISEGGGSASGFTGWLLATQSQFERMLSGAVRDMAKGVSALPVLMGIGFVYGVLHAAGPGHGKAVIASYMLANERALRRGLVIAFAAAALQGCVAVALVGIFALLLQMSALHIRDVAHTIEMVSFGCIALLGLWLIVRKGRAFLLLWRARPTKGSVAARFVCEACEADEMHQHGPSCGHVHMPDPRRLSGALSWKSATLTIFAAGARPCSGAILVLVFAMAQGVFLSGVAATFAMALGTALTTGGLAALSVFAKDLAVRLLGAQSGRAALVASGVEWLAAMVVFVVGAALLLGLSAAGG